MRRKIEEVRRAFGIFNPIIIGRKLRWAAGRDLIRSVSLKEKRKSFK